MKDTYRLVHPDGTEDLTNFNPVEEARKEAFKQGKQSAEDIKQNQLADHFQAGRKEALQDVEKMIDELYFKDIIKFSTIKIGAQLKLSKHSFEAGKREEQKRILNLIEDAKCLSKLHGSEPCDLHPKIIDADKLRKQIQEEKKQCQT